jgi:imidazolonepropionase-like amidohydrolase
MPRAFHETTIFLAVLAFSNLAAGCKSNSETSAESAPTASTASSSSASPLASASTNDGGGTRTVTVLRGVRVIDGTGAAPLENADVVIDRKWIRAVGASGSIGLPAGADIIDAHGATVLPGLISDHSHVGLVDGTEQGKGHYTQANVLRQLHQYEAFGVTTVVSLGMNAPLFYDLQSQLHAGDLPGADLFGADRGIGISAGAPPVDVDDDQLYRASTPEQARADVDETAKNHPTLLKIWVDDFRGKFPSKMSTPMIKAIVDEAHTKGLRVAAHVFYLADAKRLVDAGVDVLAHGVRDLPVDAALITAMKTHHTWYVPTLGLDETFYVFAEGSADFLAKPIFTHALQPALAAQFADPAWKTKTLADTKAIAQDKSAAAINLQNLKTLHDAGILIGFGTDSGATPLRIAGFAEHHELSLMVRAGLTPVDAIHIATQQAALLLDIHDRGTIAPGQLADLLIVSGHPEVSIDDVDKIVSVWHRGRRVAGSVESFMLDAR